MIGRRGRKIHSKIIFTPGSAVGKDNIARSMSASTSVITDIKSYLLAESFDIIGIGSTNWYNQIAKSHGDVLTPFPGDHTVVCVGNSKLLWDRRARDLFACGEKNPFNTMSIACAQHCAEICNKKNINCNVHYSHIPQPFLVSFQHLAVETNIGILHRESQLVIHPTFGPWIALRFALILEIPFPESSQHTSHHNFALDPDESLTVADILSGHEYDPLRHIRARQAFTTGRDYKYSDEQICYHYHLSGITLLVDSS
jgi:hypothetical protein